MKPAPEACPEQQLSPRPETGEGGSSIWSEHARNSSRRPIDLGFAVSDRSWSCARVVDPEVLSRDELIAVVRDQAAQLADQAAELQRLRTELEQIKRLISPGGHVRGAGAGLT